MASFRLKILTPSSQPVDAAVTSIVVPGEEGYLGVLANHAPLIATLSPGMLKIVFEREGERFYQISGGILKVFRNEALILTESAKELEQ